MSAKEDISDNAQQGETNIEVAENMTEDVLSDLEQAITSEPSESEPSDVNGNDAESGEESSYEADETDPDSGLETDQGNAGSSTGSTHADDIMIDLEETDSAATEVQKAATTAVQQKAAAKTGWRTIGGKKYHFKDSGVMDTGWQTIDGAKYHFASNGIMDNAWAVIGGKTYHFTGGKMDTGWKTIANRTYYFHPNGVKQECGRLTIDGKVCAFGNNGVLSSRNSSISDVVRYAKKWDRKIPYKSSVTGNDKTDERKLELKEGRGSDCSWFVFHCLEKFGYLTEHVHSFEWGSKPSCYKGGKEIGKDLSKARPGDVICYKYGNGKRTPQNSHVSIYIGNGQEVHCAGDTNGKGGVVISKVNKKDIYNIVRFN